MTIRAAALTVAASAAVLATSVVEAQICAGFPAPERGFYFGGRVDFPGDGVNVFGAEAAYNAAGPLSVFGGLNVWSADDMDSFNEFRAGLAFELPALGAALGPNVSTCPVAEVRWTNFDEVTSMQIPIGLGIGYSVTFPPGPAIGVYARPELVIFRWSGFGETDTQTEFGITGGAMVSFGMFTVGGEVRNIFGEDSGDPVFGIRFGVRI